MSVLLAFLRDGGGITIKQSIAGGTNIFRSFLRSVTAGGRQAFNISWLVGGRPVLDPVILMSEANRTIAILLNLLESAGSVPGCLSIIAVNWVIQLPFYGKVAHNPSPFQIYRKPAQPAIDVLVKGFMERDTEAIQHTEADSSFSG